MTQANTQILLVEDEDIIAMILEDALSREGYQVTVTSDGLAAWELLESSPNRFETILLDREMPRMDGMALLRKLKASPTHNSIPVIMETAANDAKSVQEGLDEGAYYYLTKPFQAELMLSIVHAAVQQFRDYRLLQDNVRNAERPLAFLEQGVFRFRTLEDGRMLANLFARACPEPEKTVLGLQELLVNAVEHGNLGISYAEKTRLLMDDGWHGEIERRQTIHELAERQVEIVYARDEREIRFTIRDQGVGFDWRKYLDFDPQRAFDPHGRGIAMARRMSFDQLEYQGNGNTVVATVKLAER
jgi:DNA-binding response OmpR family regulator/anti-sigma regulatory factor (Ser/Thr protein kinase)